MRAAGMANIGITIEEYMKDCWAGRENGAEEGLIGTINQSVANLEDDKRAVFNHFVNATSADKSSK